MIKERLLRTGGVQQVSNVATLTRLNVNQLFGIEIDEFPARIAEVALWMTDHIANTRLGEDFGQSYARIPLVASPGIRHGDALEVDWNAVLPAERCSYVLGNPPFVGFVFRGQAQQEQTSRLFAALVRQAVGLIMSQRGFSKQRIILRPPTRVRPLSARTQSFRVSRWHSFGRRCFAPASRSTSPIALSYGPAEPPFIA